MTYKQVNVYTGYSEFDIQGVDAFDHSGDLASAAALVRENIQNDVMEDCLDGGTDGTDLVAEFYNEIYVNPQAAVVANGEEHVMMVLPSTSPWYNMVDDVNAWSGPTWSEWMHFVDQFHAIL